MSDPRLATLVRQVTSDRCIAEFLNLPVQEVSKARAEQRGVRIPMLDTGMRR